MTQLPNQFNNDDNDDNDDSVIYVFTMTGCRDKNCFVQISTDLLRCYIIVKHRFEDEKDFGEAVKTFPDYIIEDLARRELLESIGLYSAGFGGVDLKPCVYDVFVWIKSLHDYKEGKYNPFDGAETGSDLAGLDKSSPMV